MLGLVIRVGVALISEQVLLRILAPVLTHHFESLVRRLVLFSLALQHRLVFFKRVVFGLLDLSLTLNRQESHFLVDLRVLVNNNVFEDLLGHEHEVRGDDGQHAVASLALEDDVEIAEVAALYHVLKGYALLLEEEGHSPRGNEVDELRMTSLSENELVLVGLQGSEQRDHRANEVVVLVVEEPDLGNDAVMHLHSYLALDGGSELLEYLLLIGPDEVLVRYIVDSVPHLNG